MLHSPQNSLCFAKAAEQFSNSGSRKAEILATQMRSCFVIVTVSGLGTAEPPAEGEDLPLLVVF